MRLTKIHLTFFLYLWTGLTGKNQNAIAPKLRRSRFFCYLVFKNHQSGTVTENHLPETTAYVRITQQSWQQGEIAGEVRAGEFEWEFQWCFRQGYLSVKPSAGRALIQEPLGRFLERWDYQLEPGGDYAFTIRAEL